MILREFKIGTLIISRSKHDHPGEIGVIAESLGCNPNDPFGGAWYIIKWSADKSTSHWNEYNLKDLEVVGSIKSLV